jgi:NAD(P)-dependent dehydrogenase (short-subunit alcohol dehydrogenase family)
MNERELSGRVALVTGAASGIGRATALALAGAGADVALVDRDREGVHDAAAECGALVRAEPFTVDLGDRDALAPLVDDIVAVFGTIDLLVNNAGIVSPTELLETTVETWDAVFAVNLFAPWRLIQLVGAVMVERGTRGKIVNVSSSSAFRAEFMRGPYGISKAGVAALTRAAAAELGRHDINVNAVAPGPTMTGIVEVATREEFDAVVTSGPFTNLLGRGSEPEEVASVILFLCTEASRQMTGQVLHTSVGQVV